MKGFTIIEILVAVAVFSLVVGASCGLLASGLRIQRQSLAERELLDQASFVFDYISRSARMAKKELNCLDLDDPATCDPGNMPFCLSGAGYGYGYNYEKTRNGSGLKFINTDKFCQEFFLEGARLKESRNGEEAFLTSDKLEVEVFSVTLSGESQNDNEQPKVTFFLKVKGRPVPSGQRPQLEIQTTISQRDLDVAIE